VRLIGNKTRLLSAIEGFLAERGVRGGTFLDVFAGTASVARHFRGRGFRVRSNDLLAASYAIQRTYVATGAAPDLTGALGDRAVRRFLASRDGRAAVEAVAPGPPGTEDLRRVVAFLNAGLPPREGLFARQFAAGGPAGRLFFSAGNGARIDAVHGRLLAWRRRGRIDDDGFYVLLGCLLEAADRVANISGTYGAFLKKLQTSAREPLTLRVPALDLGSPAGRAYREDGNRLVRRLKADVLYVDPPYNQRQYAKNYHVLEVLAELHTVDDLAGYEDTIYGKTGLRAFEDRLSDYCRRTDRRRGRPSPALAAFRDLVARARAEHVVVSYSEEGILSREEIGRALADAAGLERYDFARDFAEVAHKRFRSDKDAAGRRYRVLDDRRRDEVHEWLFYVRKPVGARRRARARGAC